MVMNLHGWERREREEEKEGRDGNPNGMGNGIGM